MPIPKAQLKSFLAELSRLGDKPVSKHLNKLLFQRSDEEVAMEHPELQPQPQMPPEGQPGQGQPDPAGGGQAGLPAGPGGT